jgi:hypothetical protein
MVAVVPGYVRCPKCHTPLPKTPSGPTVFHSGGTAVDSKRFPVSAVVIAGVALVAVISGYFLFRKHGNAEAAPPTETDTTTATAADDTDTGAAPPTTFAPPAPIHPEDVASELERTLKRMHLWATVEVGSSTVDVRSGSCSDPAIKPVLDSAAPRFKKAGLTRLRCLEDSGAVVFSREL